MVSAGREGASHPKGGSSGGDRRHLERERQDRGGAMRRGQQSRQPGRGLALVFAVGVAWPATAVAGEDDTSAVACREQRVPVALAPDRPADQTIFTRLCSPTPMAGRVLHVLISGATY